MLRKPALTLALVIFSSCAYAKDALHTYSIVFLQPDAVLQKRVPDIDALSAYVKDIEGAVSEAIRLKPPFPPASGFIVVAVKPGNKAKIWLDFKPVLKPQTMAAIQTAAKSVPVVAVERGVVVLAIKVGLWGAVEPNAIAPSPSEWTTAAQKAGRPVEVGDLVEMIWRD